MLYVYIAGGLCACTALTYMILLDLVRTRVSARHPDAFRAIAAGSWPKKLNPQVEAVSRFVFRRGDKGLNDPVLTRLTVLCLGVYIVSMLALIAAVAAFFTMRR